MKYINREYGYEGRPPYYKEFSRVSTRGPAINQSEKLRPYVGAGLDSDVPYGAMLIGERGSRWNIEMSFNIHGKWVGGLGANRSIGRLYTTSKNGDFTYFANGDMTTTIVKYSANALVMSIATMDSLKLKIKFAIPDPCEGEFRISDDIVKGAGLHMYTIPGEVKLDNQMSVYNDRYEVVGNLKEKEYFVAKVYRKPHNIVRDDKSVTYEYELFGKESRIFIYAAVGSRSIFDMFPEEDELINGTSMEEISYSTKKIIGAGELGRNASGFINSSMYNRIFNPYTKSNMYVESREKSNHFYAFNGIKLNASSIIASYIGDEQAVIEQLKLAVKDEVLSPLAVWMAYSRSRDINLLETLYPILIENYKPINKLVLSKDKNEVSYCMDKSPLKELSNKKPMYSLDKSCLNLLAMDIMDRISLILGKKIKEYSNAKNTLKELINDELWNSRLGLYMNKYEDGNWADSFGITSFYPLIAGAISGLDKLEKLVINLSDPILFNGERIIPTLCMTHPEYGRKVIGANDEVIPPYKYYRGEIVPYINYLIYQGLIRYGVHDVAGEVALKSARLWYNRYKKGGYEVVDTHFPAKRLSVDNSTAKIENEIQYDDIERHSLSGNLMALMGLNDLIDVEYFRDDLKLALRFGSMTKGNNNLSRMSLLGRVFGIDISDNTTTLNIDDNLVFRGDGGKFVIRQYLERKNSVEFIVMSKSIISININLPLLGIIEDEYSLTFSVPQGTHKIIIFDGKAEIIKV